MFTVPEHLQDMLKRLGFECRVVSAIHVEDLRRQIEGGYIQGNFAEQFYRERLHFYQFFPPEELPIARSIIVVAVPRPQTPVNFIVDEKLITLVLPPTYARYNQITGQVGDTISAILAPEDFHTAPTRLPLKLLAACSGLAEYGRNNVCYINGLGSFFQLAAYYSDLPCQEETWQEPRMLERCKSCTACLKKCPTGAITPDRFLLHAERCLTFHNESKSSRPFPAGLDPTVHNSLMGCMLCQRFCPEDKPFQGWFEESVNFSQDETLLLLNGAVREQLPEDMMNKLQYLELIDDLDKLPRNLHVLLNQTTDSGK